MKRLVWFIALGASLCAADRTGPYLGAGVGLSSYNDGGRAVEVESKDVAQVRLNAGAFINKYFSVALEYGYFETFDGLTPSGEKVHQNFNVLTAEVSAHYPLLDDQLDLFASFGAGEIFWDETGPEHFGSSAATLVYGAGAGVRPLPWLTFNIGYDFYQFGMDDGDQTYDMSLGSAYLECQVLF